MPEGYKDNEVAAVISAHNEADRVFNVMQGAYLAERVDMIVIVDDASTDDTCSVAEAFMNSVPGNDKKVAIVVGHENQGKTEAMRAGVECAKELGGTSLQTIVFLDADSSPDWSRETEVNMKWGQKTMNKIFQLADEPLPPEFLEHRREIFTELLALYIDAMIKPVSEGRQVMRAGMYSHNKALDMVLRIFRYEWHAGNRAIPLRVWDNMWEDLDRHGLQLDRWEIEGALNSYVDGLGEDHGSFVMQGVVNVGSRVKTGGLLKGVGRMYGVHSNGVKGAMKTRPLGVERAKKLKNEAA